MCPTKELKAFFALAESLPTSATQIAFKISFVFLISHENYVEFPQWEINSTLSWGEHSRFLRTSCSSSPLPPCQRQADNQGKPRPHRWSPRRHQSRSPPDSDSIVSRGRMLWRGKEDRDNSAWPAPQLGEIASGDTFIAGHQFQSWKTFALPSCFRSCKRLIKLSSIEWDPGNILVKHEDHQLIIWSRHPLLYTIHHRVDGRGSEVWALLNPKWGEGDKFLT